MANLTRNPKRGLDGVDKLQVRRPGRILAIAASALLLMMAVVVTSPRDPVMAPDSFSVGIGHEVTDTVTTDAAPPHQPNTDAAKQVTIVLGTVAMIAVVGLAFARRKSHGSDRL
jgi:hypothetical protein